MKRSRLVLLVVGILLMIVGVGGLFIWNKPHRKAEDERGLAISADSLLAAYAANEQTADARFLNKTIELRGTVVKVDTNQAGQTTVLFASADPLSTVFCTMRDKGDRPADSGQVAVVKGFCSGHTTDVLLTDCISVR